MIGKNYNVEFLIEKLRRKYRYYMIKFANRGSSIEIVSLDNNGSDKIKEIYKPSSRFLNEQVESGCIFHIEPEECHVTYIDAKIMESIYNDYLNIFDKYADEFEYMAMFSNYGFVIKTDKLEIIYDILNTLKDYSYCQAEQNHFFVKEYKEENYNKVEQSTK